MSSMSFSTGKQFVRPPQRGIFPLDHDSECRSGMEVRVVEDVDVNVNANVNVTVDVDVIVMNQSTPCWCSVVVCSPPHL